MTLIIVLFILASTLIVAEVMFPSFGILGLLAATSFLVAILDAFSMGDTQGYTSVGAAIVLIPTAIATGFYVLNHTSFGNKLVLKAPDKKDVSGMAVDRKLEDLQGMIGKSLTPLRPSGTIEIADTTVDAVSEGDFIDEDKAVKVTYVEGNRVVVEALENGQSA